MQGLLAESLDLFEPPLRGVVGHAREPIRRQPDNAIGCAVQVNRLSDRSHPSEVSQNPCEIAKFS